MAFWNRFFLGESKTKLEVNPTNDFFSFLGNETKNLHHNNETYIKQFTNNPIVFSVIDQMASKTASIPFQVKKIKDQNAHRQIKSLDLATNGIKSINQLCREIKLKNTAYDEVDLDFPMEAPNKYQTWNDLLYLYKLYLKLTGNVYLYIMSTDKGNDAGKPQYVFILPSDKMKIVVKENVSIFGVENPVEEFLLIDRDKRITFKESEIIHIKTQNPYFSFDYSHLYGLSPLKAALLNIQTTNNALSHNDKAMKNSGVYGFIHGKNTSLTPEQANSLKQRLVEMDKSPERLSRIAGSSGDIAFTRISLTTDELKPFDFLNYDQKQICNVLRWSDKLMNSDDGAKYDNVKEYRKQVIVDNILPDLKLLESHLNKNFIKKFKGYENAVLSFDISELQEMQEDMKLLSEWMDKAPLTPNEKRIAFRYETLEDDGMDVVWIEGSKKRIDEVSVSTSDINKAFDY